jgi:hypothetical protein
MQEPARIRNDVEDRPVREKAVRRDDDNRDLRTAVSRKVRDRQHAAIRRQEIDDQYVKALKPQRVDGGFLIFGEHGGRALPLQMVAPKPTDCFI